MAAVNASNAARGISTARETHNTRILYVTSSLEHPAAGGPQLRVETSIKALSKVCELHVCGRNHLPTRLRDQTRAFFTSICGNPAVVAPSTERSAHRRGLVT